MNGSGIARTGNRCADPVIDARRSPRVDSKVEDGSPVDHDYVQSYRRLALAVVCQAIKDAKLAKIPRRFPATIDGTVLEESEIKPLERRAYRSKKDIETARRFFDDEDGDLLYLWCSWLGADPHHLSKTMRPLIRETIQIEAKALRDERRELLRKDRALAARYVFKVGSRRR